MTKSWTRNSLNIANETKSDKKPTKFSSVRAHLKTSILNYFLTFQDKRLDSRNVTNESKPDEKLTDYDRRKEKKTDMKPNIMPAYLQNTITSRE